MKAQRTSVFPHPATVTSAPSGSAALVKAIVATLRFNVSGALNCMYI